MNKYHARKVIIDGIQFDSQAEGNHYLFLKSEREAGRISDLECHPRYCLLGGRVWNGKRYRSITYSPDFRYLDIATGKTIIEDVKGGKATQTTASTMRIKMLVAILPEDEFDFRVVEA